MKIVAIGGGGISRHGKKGETTAIDRRIVALSGKRRPRLLFIPTASGDDERYAFLITRHFAKLGCRVETLCLLRSRPSVSTIRSLIASADIIYVGGGNTLRMMNLWRRLGVDRLLVAAARRGCVMSGLSAGAICWFRQGNSDSRKYSGKSKALIKVRGLGLIDAFACPHFDTEKNRPKGLKNDMRTTKGVGIAIEECAALVCVDGSFEEIVSRKGAKVHKAFWRKGKYHLVPLTSKSLAASELLRKP
ncbi:MAG: peptidase E [Nanoarchaeota archaeon]